MPVRAWLAVVLALALGACDDDDTRDGGDAVDAGSADAGDAGSPDSGLRDSGARDAGTLDGGADGGDGSSDGGAPDGGAGECPAAAVVIEERCPPFGACGGELALGEYCYDGLCIEEEDVLAPMPSFCATLRILEATGSVTGRVSIREGDELERASLTSLDVTALFPANCVVNGCDEVETLIEREVEGSTATCTMTDECRCAVSIRTAVGLTESYTADPAAGILRVGAGVDERAYDYCVDDDGSVRFRDRPGGVTEPGIQSIARDA